ncbi:MAG: MFS transporter [Legionella sp.]|nr:MFS transporter [Legionella sp.]
MNYNHNQNYLYFLSAQLFGYLAQWLFYFVVSWYVYELTHHAGLLGLIALSALIPTLIFGQLSGLLTDKLDSKKLLKCVQLGFLSHGLLSLILVILGCFNIQIICMLVILQGIILAFDKPVKQAILPSFKKIVSIEKIIAVNALCLNSARLLAPLLAGVLLKQYNISICFILYFIFIASSACFTLMLHVDKRSMLTQNQHNSSLLRLFKGQNKYLSQNKTLIILLLLASVLSWTLGPVTMLLPVLNHELYAGNSEMLGFLFAACALGNVLIGVFKLVVVEKQHDRMQWIFVSILGAVVSLVLFVLGANQRIALFLLFLSAAFQLYALLSINIEIQRRCDEAFRGRVLALFMLGFAGLTPLSNCLAGILVDIFSVKSVILANCFICFMICFILGFMVLLTRQEETAYLMASPKNAARLNQAVSEIEQD